LEAIASEIKENRQILAAVLAQKPETFKDFCYPSGVTSQSAPDLLDRLGVRSATTTVRGIAFPGDPAHMLRRILDGEQLSNIEFEAELSGFSELLRKAFRLRR
jgi:hypothetical protein